MSRRALGLVGTLMVVAILGLPAVIGILAYIYTGHSPFDSLQVMISGLTCLTTWLIVALWRGDLV